MKQVSDNSPANASISIDYTKGNKVRFSYRKRDKKGWRLFLMVFNTFLLTYILVICLVCVLVLIIALTRAVLMFAFYPWLFNSVPEVMPICYCDDTPYLVYLYRTLLGLLIILAPPLWCAFIVFFRYEKYSKVYPKFNAYLSGLIFKKQHSIKRKLKEPKVTIPVFSNIILEYKATKEFSEYLENVKVKKNPFLKYKWTATFYFKKIPKSGQIELWWI